MSEEPRENRRMLNTVEKTYDTALYTGDGGMWTVIETTKRPILKGPSQNAANLLIAQLKKANEATP